MTRFQVWSAAGPYAARRYHGEHVASNFQQACYELASDDFEFGRKLNPLHLTWNGYNLHPSEQALIDSFSIREQS